MSYIENIGNIGGVFPRPISPAPAEVRVTRVDVGMKARNASLQAHSLPPNHSSKDRGMHPLMMGSSRTRHGNR